MVGHDGVRIGAIQGSCEGREVKNGERIEKDIRKRKGNKEREGKAWGSKGRMRRRGQRKVLI